MLKPPFLKDRAIENLIDDSRDVICLINNVTWAEYESVLSDNENLVGRISYFDKNLEIMSPSRNHELAKKIIGILIEEYFDLKEIEYFPLGSTTFRQKPRAGKEPDQSYCIGTDKDVPDLAIEIVFSSGGLDDLEIYTSLKVPEVWFWKGDRLYIYSLTDNKYFQSQTSVLLPDLDIKLLEQCMLSQSNITEVKKYFRKCFN